MRGLRDAHGQGERAPQWGREPGQRAIRHDEESQFFGWAGCDAREGKKFGPTSDWFGGDAGSTEDLNADASERRERVARRKFGEFEPEAAVRIKTGGGRRVRYLGGNQPAREGQPQRRQIREEQRGHD